MAYPPMTKHVSKEELDAFMNYAEDNYSTIFEAAPGEGAQVQPEPAPEPEDSDHLQP